MRRLLLAVAAAVVVASNVLLLVCAARNRSGAPEAEIVLTERELPPEAEGEESTALFLRIEYLPAEPFGTKWLDRAKLESLGFDCRYPVDAPSAPEHYRRATPRRAFVALEYEGDAWRRWVDERQARSEAVIARIEGNEMDPAACEQKVLVERKLLEQAREETSRLFAVDAARTGGELRARFPDRSKVLVLPAVIWIDVAPPSPASKKAPAPQALRGRIDPLLPASVHVPKRARAVIDAQRGPKKDGKPRYEVRLRCGSRHEPWIEEIRGR